MKIFSSLFLTLALAGTAAYAQDYPLDSYEELSDGSVPDRAAWSRYSSSLIAGWAPRDVHVRKHDAPVAALCTDTTVRAWRGERIGVQALVYTPVAGEALVPELTSWRPVKATGARGRVKARCGEASFVRYVMTDAFQRCGNHPDNLKPYLVPDVIDRPGTALAGEEAAVRPVWCSFEVPRGQAPGRYELQLLLRSAATGRVVRTLDLAIEVQPHTLPKPAEQQFHLDLWQQPYAVARYHKVEKWSKEHFAALRPQMERLARAGQRVVSAILFYEPWGVQSHDKFDPMVQTTLEADGSWSYDYTVFDRWVEFMASCGIDRQINCFSMVPWDMSFRYYDRAKGEYAYLKTNTATAEYEALWTDFLKSFAAHLKKKGWYDKTCIAMDERGLSNMLDAYRVAQTAVPGIRMALAGTYHKELSDKLQDYCIGWGEHFTAEERAARRARGQVTTTYNCCSTPSPNVFSNSEPVEAVYIPVHCAANDFDGYLRWAYMNWAEDPLRDSRFRLFAPGDTYCVYPGDRSSVRFERFHEGIQAFEKIHLLREQFRRSGDSAALARLDALVAEFATPRPGTTAQIADRVNRLEAFLNSAPAE